MECFCFVCFHCRSATVGSWQARYRHTKNLKKLPRRRQRSKQVALDFLRLSPSECLSEDGPRTSFCLFHKVPAGQGAKHSPCPPRALASSWGIGSGTRGVRSPDGASAGSGVGSARGGHEALWLLPRGVYRSGSDNVTVARTAASRGRVLRPVGPPSVRPVVAPRRACAEGAPEDSVAAGGTGPPGAGTRPVL